MATEQEKVLDEINTERNTQMAESDASFDQQIAESDQFFQGQIEASKNTAQELAANQQAQTDFAIEQIEQQKAEATRESIEEQAGAYADWQEQSNPYGVNAEQMAAQGMQNTGYAESAKVSMYNSYQNRVAMATKSLDSAVLNLNNAIQEARLQNNAALAEIALNAFQEQAEFILQGFQYRNSLLTQKTQARAEINNSYLDVLKEINENSGAYLLNDDAEGSPGDIYADIPSVISSYEEAVQYLKNRGVSMPGTTLSPLSEWSKHRGGYSTYQEYLKDYVTYAIEEHANKEVNV